MAPGRPRRSRFCTGARSSRITSPGSTPWRTSTAFSWGARALKRIRFWTSFASNNFLRGSMGIIIALLSVIFLILCVLLVIIILLQSDKSAGMGILGGSRQSAFGSSTADVITQATGAMIGLFMIGSLGLATLESSRMDNLKKEILKTEDKAKAPVKDEEKKPDQQK